MLGGGHGVLQGHYGMLSDNLVEARVVLADGSAVTVSSDSNPDLFWGLRGAGHNFGIVSEFKYKVYDKDPEETWTFADFYFDEKKLEQVYLALNELTNNGTKFHSQKLFYVSFFMRIPKLDPNNVSCSCGTQSQS
jgi:FAD/FMN-containing dehydrogenase